MTVRKLAVVSVGLSLPSSTRLLADRLAAATRKSLESQGFRARHAPDVRLPALGGRAHSGLRRLGGLGKGRRRKRSRAHRTRQLAAGELATLLGDRIPSGRPDPYAAPTPFEDLLAGG